MPYINIHITSRLNDDQKDLMKSKLGELITMISGKSEDVLMIGIQDKMTIYFAGEKKEKAAFVDIRLFGASPDEEKIDFSRAVFALLDEHFGISGDSLFLTYIESDNWGFKGNHTCNP